MSNYHYSQADAALQLALNLIREGEPASASEAVAVADAYARLGRDGAPAPTRADGVTEGDFLGNADLRSAREAVQLSKRLLEHGPNFAPASRIASDLAKFILVCADAPNPPASVFIPTTDKDN